MVDDNEKLENYGLDEYTRYEAIVRSLLAKQLRHECRMSDRQIAMLKWSQIGDHEINVSVGRPAVKISHTLYTALMAAPCKSAFVFSVTPLTPFGIPPETKTEHTHLWRKIKERMPKIRIEMPSKV